MLIDYERLLLDLKATIAEKGSHGQRDLLSEIARLEAKHAIQPDEYERFVRQFGHHLADSFMGLIPRVEEDDDPPTGAAASAPVVAGDPHLRRPTRDSEESWQTQRPQSRQDPPPEQTSAPQGVHHERPAATESVPA